MRLPQYLERLFQIPRVLSLVTSSASAAAAAAAGTRISRICGHFRGYSNRPLQRRALTCCRARQSAAAAAAAAKRTHGMLTHSAGTETRFRSRRRRSIPGGDRLSLDRVSRRVSRSIDRSKVSTLSLSPHHHARTHLHLLGQDPPSLGHPPETSVPRFSSSSIEMCF